MPDSKCCGGCYYGRHVNAAGYHYCYHCYGTGVCPRSCSNHRVTVADRLDREAEQAVDQSTRDGSIYLAEP